MNTERKLEKALSEGTSVVALRQLLGSLNDDAVVRIAHHSDDHGTYYNGVIVETCLQDKLHNLAQTHLAKQGVFFDEGTFREVLEVVIQRAKEAEADDLCTRPLQVQLDYLMDQYEEDEASIAHHFQHALDTHWTWQGMTLGTNHLPDTARALAETTLACLREHLGKEPHTGGCTAFYSPEDWKYDFANNAALMVVHDGGDLAPFFNWDYCDYALIEAVNAYLEPLGYYTEQCTSWYSGIYPIEANP